MKSHKRFKPSSMNALTRIKSPDLSPRPFHAPPDQQWEEHKENKTGLPDKLKGGIENLSGISLDDVKVYYNSDKPAHLQAHAYAQGSDIHIAFGQEKHLPHEAWHIVQQKQGRVRPTFQMKNKVNINDDKRLEKEADVMGVNALRQNYDKKRIKNSNSGKSPIQRMSKRKGSPLTPAERAQATAKGEQNYLSKSGHGRADHGKRASSTPQKTKDHQAAKSKQKAIDEVIQLKRGAKKENKINAPLSVDSDVIQQRALTKNKMNVAGETHAESNPIRDEERKYAEAMTGGVYKTEGEFKTSKWALFGSDRLGDPMMLRVEMLLAILKEKTLVEILTPFGNKQIPPKFANVPVGDVETLWSIYKEELRKQLGEIVTGLNLAIEDATEKTQAARAIAVHEALLKLYDAMPLSLVKDVQNDIIPEINRIIQLYATNVLQLPDIRPENTVSAMRSTAMQEAAADNAARIIGSQVGVWKVGESHIQEIARDKQGDGYELLTKAEFNAGFNDWRAKVATRSEGKELIDDGSYGEI